MIDKIKQGLGQAFGAVRLRLGAFDRRYRWAKYLAVVLLFAGYTLVWSDKTIWQYAKFLQRESYLEGQIETYAPKLRADSISLEGIENLGDRVEEIARTQYLMKSAGEDIYIIRGFSESSESSENSEISEPSESSAKKRINP